MAQITSILVNNKTYKVQKLDVLETIYLHAEALHLLGDLVGSLLEIWVRVANNENVNVKELGTTLAKADPEAIKKLAPKIYAQVITPENTILGSQDQMESWFSKKENKADPWEVLVKAGAVLLGEYLPDVLKKIFQIEKTNENPA